MLSKTEFHRAADFLASRLCGEADTEPPEKEAEFLRALRYLDDRLQVNADTVWPGLPQLIRFAARLDRIFATRVATMPGLFFIGAQQRFDMPEEIGSSDRRQKNVSFGGSGLAPAQAFERCVGEAIEYFSSQNVLRKIADDQRSSTGFAAGRSISSAKRSAALECLERNSLASWYVSRAPVTEIVPNNQLTRVSSFLRGGRNSDIMFLMIEASAPEYPTVIATSRITGECVAGYGCAPDIFNACVKAACELGQGELGVLLEQQLEGPPQNGFIARSAHFKSRNSLFIPQSAHELNSLRDRGGLSDMRPYDGFTFTETTLPDVNIPCVLAKNADLRDVVVEIPAGEIGPL